VFADGSGAGPVDSATNTYAFIGVTAIVTVSSTGQVVHVSASKALGSTAAGGAGGLSLSVCRRTLGSAAAPVDIGGEYMEGLRIGPNERLPFSLVTRFVGLTAGTYEVGLCGYTTPGQGANWNSNEWSRVTVVLAQQ
jgi:hypothetical protein